METDPDCGGSPQGDTVAQGDYDPGRDQRYWGLMTMHQSAIIGAGDNEKSCQRELPPKHTLKYVLKVIKERQKGLDPQAQQSSIGTSESTGVWYIRLSWQGPWTTCLDCTQPPEAGFVGR